MKIELLASTIENGKVANKQHLASLVVDDLVAIDAGSLSFSTSMDQKTSIRDIVLTHAHIDHIAGLPLFIDDLFSSLEKPIKVHASDSVIRALKTHIFNWEIYPDFAELENDHGAVLEYCSLVENQSHDIGGLEFTPYPVNHKVDSHGYVVKGNGKTIALTGDTAEVDSFWTEINSLSNLDGLFVECAFPNELEELAKASHHLTPSRLKAELEKFEKPNCPIFVINLKPMHREVIASQLDELGIERLKVLDVGTVLEF